MRLFKLRLINFTIFSFPQLFTCITSRIVLSVIQKNIQVPYSNSKKIKPNSVGFVNRLQGTFSKGFILNISEYIQQYLNKKSGYILKSVASNYTLLGTILKEVKISSSKYNTRISKTNKNVWYSWLHW